MRNVLVLFSLWMSGLLHGVAFILRVLSSVAGHQILLSGLLISHHTHLQPKPESSSFLLLLLFILLTTSLNSLGMAASHNYAI